MRNIKVLLVEDDVLLCELLREAVEHNGMYATTAYSGKDALRAYIRARFEVIVLDLELPDTEGLEVLSAIRDLKEEPPPRVIIFSAHDDEVVRLKAQNLGVDEYLSKPADTLYLAARVRALACRIHNLSVHQ